jgi:hypothetical protein
MIRDGVIERIETSGQNSGLCTLIDDDGETFLALASELSPLPAAPLNEVKNG